MIALRNNWLTTIGVSGGKEVFTKKTVYDAELFIILKTEAEPMSFNPLNNEVSYTIFLVNTDFHSDYYYYTSSYIPTNI